jgi:hypothetical protein
MPKKSTEGQARTLASIEGKVISARKLNNTKLVGKSRPYCIVKGIKGNSHLVEFFRTPVGEGHNPVWDAEWRYNCLQYRTREDFVGVKFLVYDGEEFLGGADYDISEISAYQTVAEELELSGIVLVKVNGKSLRKPILWMELAISKTWAPVWKPLKENLLLSMRSWQRVTSINACIVSARGLRGRMGKSSLPMCFVRCMMSSGKIMQLHTTATPHNGSCVDPHWDQKFFFDFQDEQDQPLMIIFDMFGTANLGGFPDPLDVWHAGDHLGSAMYCVDNIPDQAAFREGAGQHLKLQLHNESQLIEKRLARDGKQMIADDWATSAAAGASLRRTNKDKMDKAQEDPGSSGKNEKYHLTININAERIEQPMPHRDLMGSVETSEVDDMEKMDNPDPELLEHFREGAKRLTISADERIVTVYGRISSALDLVQANLLGKSDPYVVVEALTISGQLIFMYRSRVVVNDLNPNWDEGFIFKVPPDPDNVTVPVPLAKVLFSIFDSNEGLLDKVSEGEDEFFLGRCNVDVAFMRNCDYVNEDIPLLGCKGLPGGFKSQGGFRRYSTLSVEIRVERQVKRMVDADRSIAPEILEVKRHHESRPMYPPEVRGYRDLGQLASPEFTSAVHDSAGKVIALRETNQLLALADLRRKKGEASVVEGKGWLKVPEFVMPQVEKPTVIRRGNDIVDHASESDESEVVVSKRRTYITALKDDYPSILKRSKADMLDLEYVGFIPSMPRSASLPSLCTRFGPRYKECSGNPFEEGLKPKPERLQFADQRQRTTFMDVCKKPPFEAFCRRKPGLL